MKPINELDDSLKSRKRKRLDEKELLDNLKKETNFEKNDAFALIVAALTTIMPVVIVILVLYYVISMLFFG